MAVEASSVRLVDPRSISRNPENPRLIFREDELLALQESIEAQGILVPLTIYERENGYVILDGERRWRCAIKLGLDVVPVIVQPQPDAVTNIMMMFAIHKTRNDWDPLPTAMKLQDLQQALTGRNGRKPTEQELAAAASISRGEVRRYRNIMELPERYRSLLIKELDKPRSAQKLTVDHVLESTRGAQALLKASIISENESHELVDVLIDKFVNEVLSSTVEPRYLTRIARAVSRGELTLERARKAVLKIINSVAYTVADAFRESIEQVDYEHATEQLANRVYARLEEMQKRSYDLGDALREELQNLRDLISTVLRA